MRVDALNTGNTFRVVSTFNETLDCLLDADDPVFTVPFCVLCVIVSFKGLEVVLQDLLNDILFVWVIDGQTSSNNPLPYINRSNAGFVLPIFGGKVFFGKREGP